MGISLGSNQGGGRIFRKLNLDESRSRKNWALPAVDHDGAGVRNGVLSAVHLLQETQDPPGLVRDPVVRPAQILVVPDGPGRLVLKAESDENASRVRRRVQCGSHVTSYQLVLIKDHSIGVLI